MKGIAALGLGIAAPTTATTVCVPDGLVQYEFNCQETVGENGILWDTYTGTVTVNASGTAWVTTNAQSLHDGAAG